MITLLHSGRQYQLLFDLATIYLLNTNVCDNNIKIEDLDTSSNNLKILIND